MTRAQRLQAYIDAADGPPTIGVDDCAPWAARWIEQETGRQLGFARYSTRDEGYAILDAAGGLANYAAGLLSWLPIAFAPKLGDVAILQFSDKEVAGIFANAGMVAIRGEHRGVFYMKPRSVVRAWSLP